MQINQGICGGLLVKVKMKVKLSFRENQIHAVQRHRTI
jgi:hypothetical protein